MRLIALEEHVHLAALGGGAHGTTSGSASGGEGPGDPRASRVARLREWGDKRLADMDAAGVAVQVLSQTVGGVPGDVSVGLVRQANDELAEIVATHPDRFAAFALLPMSDPEAAAAELARTVGTLGFKGALVGGAAGGRFLDDRGCWPVFAAASALGVPVYLHPGSAPDAVRQAYYGGLPEPVARVLATNAWGWHVETGLHVLRLIVAGLFDEIPGLTMIVGHMGEALPFLLARSSRKLAGVTTLGASVADTFVEHFYVTTSGMFTYQPLQCLLGVVGADRVLFSVDYPYDDNAEGRAFLDGAPIGRTDKEKIAHRNAEALLGL